MRIFALATDAYGGRGGIAQFNRDFFDALTRAEDIQETVILPRWNNVDKAVLPSKKTVQLKARPHQAAYAAAALYYAVTRGPFDVIWCGHLYLVPLAFVLSWILRVPFWIQVHGIEAWCPPRKTGIGFCVKKAEKIFAVSRFTRRRFLSWANCEPRRVKILPNTVDDQVFTPGKKSDELIQKFQLQGKKIILTTSRLSAQERYKGHEQVLRVLPRLLQVNPDWVYVIAGEGDDRLRLEQIARELGVESVVRFVGTISTESLVCFYRTADVFAMPSTGEGFGIVFLEALACGLSVIAGDSDGSRDPLRDGAAGQLIEAHNLEMLEKAIVRAAAESNPRNFCAEAFSKKQFQNTVEHFIRRAA